MTAHRRLPRGNIGRREQMPIVNHPGFGRDSLLGSGDQATAVPRS
jgi:hypothetical protein